MWSSEDYTIIIGHRRAAAAQQAGKFELPCSVVDMTEKEQLQTMMVENMQRSDLTVYEQAQGFQMMLDMGDTVECVADRSGFSQSTIRRRIKLLELNHDNFKKADAPCDRCKAAHPNCDKCCKACDEPCNAAQACKKDEERTENND